LRWGWALKILTRVDNPLISRVKQLATIEKITQARTLATHKAVRLPQITQTAIGTRSMRLTVLPTVQQASQEGRPGECVQYLRALSKSVLFYISLM
jgi:hypothetical protein